jgi:hypothetical protein
MQRVSTHIDGAGLGRGHASQPRQRGNACTHSPVMACCAGTGACGRLLRFCRITAGDTRPLAQPLERLASPFACWFSMGGRVRALLAWLYSQLGVLYVGKRDAIASKAPEQLAALGEQKFGDRVTCLPCFALHIASANHN